MLSLKLLLCLTVACSTSHHTTNSTLNTIRNALAKITQLTLGFLRLTLGVLLTAGIFETLVAD